MKTIDWIFGKDVNREKRVFEPRDDYERRHIKDVAIGDEVKGIGTVTDKYKFLGDWVLWCGHRQAFIEKGTYVWVKQ